MNTEIKTAEPEIFIHGPWWFMFRGGMMFVIGTLLSICAIVAPDVKMLSVSASWLPVSSFLVLLVGVLRSIDAFASDRTSLYLLNIQGSIIDIVCGFFILASIGEGPLTFSLIIAAYLTIQGLFRIIVTFSIQIHNPTSTRIGGLVSILLGLMVWLNWPFSALWFLSFVLSGEIANRGWVLMCYAHSVNKQQKARE